MNSLIQKAARWLGVVAVLWRKELRLLLARPPFYVATALLTAGGDRKSVV